jgi:hypothetical protein
MRFRLLATAALALSTLATDHARAETPSEEGLNRVVADYVGLYRRETLDAWRGLFLPGFTAASTRPDGSVLVRTRRVGSCSRSSKKRASSGSTR